MGVYCPHCVRDVTGVHEDGYTSCNICGRLLIEQNLCDEPTFFKNSAGQSKLSGTYVRTVQSEFSASRERTLERALEGIRDLVYHLLGESEDSVAYRARSFYQIALERNFTRGRISEQVQAACLYIAFRLENKPFLLIDFSDVLRTNVYVLGAVFLQLCKLLRLGEHPIVQKPVDPSLFILKFTKALLNLKKEKYIPTLAVSGTALSIIASMKRDWIQTGRKPSGLCGAALYISALAHGCACTKHDILRIVHVCEATLTKRLVEFENTESASLTIDELNAMAKEHEKNPIVMPDSAIKDSISKNLLCEHRDDSRASYFALGLCEACYRDFDKISGGLGGGCDPPAFQRAERERMKNEMLSKESADDESPELVEAPNGACKGQKEDFPASVPERNNVDHKITKDDKHDESRGEDDTGVESNEEPEEESATFSDIDDCEVDGYLLHNEEEKKLKKKIWETMNWEYLEEQAAKEAAAAAGFSTETVGKPKKEKQRRGHQEKNTGPAESAADAACQMAIKKRLSKKVNYECLRKLFGDEELSDAGNPKKVRFDLPSDYQDKSQSKVEDKKDVELGSTDDFEDDYQDGEETGEYRNNWSSENYDESYYNQDEGYNYNYDDEQY